MLRAMTLLLFAPCLLAQDFSRDEVKHNPARFRMATWDDTFTVPASGKGTIVFPANISTYRMPSCELTDAATGKSPKGWQWLKVERVSMSYKATPLEKVAIHCYGPELKPWRASPDSALHRDSVTTTKKGAPDR